jgi:hypothetical protein
VDLLLANAVKSLGSPLENITDSIQMWISRIFPWKKKDSPKKECLQ